jgi:hypothetical protein
MAAPTHVANYVTVFNSNASPRSQSITTAVGDRLVVVAATEDTATTLGTPTGGGLTYSLAQSVSPGASFSRVYIWTATATAASTFNVDITAAGGGQFGFAVVRHSGSNGFGNSAGTSNASGAPSLALTTTAAESAIVAINADWNAGAGARTWRTINSITPTLANTLEFVYAATGNYTAYAARWNDAGTAGAKTTGLSAPTGQKYVIAAIEVLGTGSSTQDISPGGIASAEAFGTAVIGRGPVDIAPGGVASAEAFGTATLNSTNTIAPGSIASAEAFGTATISTANSILPGGIASAEAFGTAIISTTNEILPGGIASGEAFGNAVVALQGTQIVQPTGIASAEVFGTATITPGSVDVAPSGIGSAEAFGTAVITAEATIAPAGIASGEAFGTAAITPGAVSILPSGIASAEAFGTPTVTDSSAGLIIAPPGIPSGEAFGQPIVWTHIVRACDCSVLVDD